MNSYLRPILSLVPFILLCGCQSSAVQSPPQPTPPAKTTPNPAVHDNAFNLLCDLLEDEKDLSKVLIIKRASPELKELVKNISKTAEADLKTLKKREGIKPDQAKKDTRLPPGEKATREAISKTKEHELLHASGGEFEFQLLLSQAEALNYGKHLARVISENESDVDKSRQFSAMSQQLDQLGGQVLARLRPH